LSFFLSRRLDPATGGNEPVRSLCCIRRFFNFPPHSSLDAIGEKNGNSEAEFCEAPTLTTTRRADLPRQSISSRCLVAPSPAKLEQAEETLLILGAVKWNEGGSTD
jgi:hypothetical protein